jgi:hypothetical protein
MLEKYEEAAPLVVLFAYFLYIPALSLFYKSPPKTPD